MWSMLLENKELREKAMNYLIDTGFFVGSKKQDYIDDLEAQKSILQIKIDNLKK